MTANQFRHLALDLPETVESSHFAHPDFRVRNKIFATLGYPDSHWGMIKLNPEQQAEVISAASAVYRPAAGAWGRSGSTLVLLAAVDAVSFKPILLSAWENLTAKAQPRKRRRAQASSKLKRLR